MFPSVMVFPLSIVITCAGALVKRGVVDALARRMKPTSTVPSGASDR